MWLMPAVLLHLYSSSMEKSMLALHKISKRPLWLQKSVFSHLMVNLIYFWESSQMFDLQHSNSSFSHHIQTDNSWPTNFKRTWLLIKTNRPKCSWSVLVPIASKRTGCMVSSCWKAERCLLRTVSFQPRWNCHFTQLTKTNKSSSVTRSRVPSSHADGNGRLNWNPSCPPFTWKSLRFASLSSCGSNQETAS